MISDTYTFAVSEIMPGERLLVTVYARVGQHVHLVMTLYSDATMRTGETLIDVHLLNSKEQ